VEILSLISTLPHQALTILNGPLPTFVELQALALTTNSKAKRLVIGGTNAVTLPTAHICARSCPLGSLLDASYSRLGAGNVAILTKFASGLLSVQPPSQHTWGASLAKTG
jgi:hypothetical protein